MEKKTHIALGNLASLILVCPESINALLTTVSFATLGSILPDVDLKDSTTDKIFDRLITSMITIIILGIFINYSFNINLYDKIREYGQIFNYILCTCLFTIMAYMGSKTHHRSFTHSILGLIIYTLILSYTFSKNAVIPFFISYASHIIIDLLNKRGLTLFYPIKSRFCFNLCESNGTINRLLFSLFSFLCILVVIISNISLT